MFTIGASQTAFSATVIACRVKSRRRDQGGGKDPVDRLVPLKKISPISQLTPVHVQIRWKLIEEGFVTTGWVENAPLKLPREMSNDGSGKGCGCQGKIPWRRI